MTKWICRRCKAFVVETKDGKRCECTDSPSPWEPVDIESLVTEEQKNTAAYDAIDCYDKEGTYFEELRKMIL